MNGGATRQDRNAKGETTTAALRRIVTQKTGVDVESDLSYIEQLYTFDTVDRDPRGHAVSVTYLGCGQLSRSTRRRHMQHF